MLRKSILAILLIVSSVSLIWAQDKSSDEIIKVDTTLVSIPVIVSDRNGRYIPNLQANDFKIYQDGALQKVDFFAATEEPLNVALLIDTSRSTQNVLGDIKDAARDFIKLLQPRDRAMIVSFDYEPHVLSPLTSNQEQLRNAVRNADIGEYVGTALRDAVSDVVTRSFAGVKGRKAIILLTDGKDAGSQTSISDLLYSLQESDTLIYSVFFQTGRLANQNQIDFPEPPRRRRDDIFGGGRFPRNNRFPRDNGRFPRFPNPRQQQRNEQRRARVEEKNEQAEAFLQRIADMTAGRYYSSEVENLRKTFGLIVDELRYQYRLGFYPADDKNTDLHELKVKVARPDAIVRARNNYRSQN